MTDIDRESDQRSPAPSTSLSLLERTRANDPQAWCRLVHLYQPLVHYWCGRLGVPATATEDVTQEVFAAAAVGLALFRRDRPGDTFRGWLRGITRNQALLHFRRTRGQPRAEGGSEARANLENIADPLPDVGEDEPAEVSQLYRRAVEQ